MATRDEHGHWALRADLRKRQASAARCSACQGIGGQHYNVRKPHAEWSAEIDAKIAAGADPADAFRSTPSERRCPQETP